MKLLREILTGSIAAVLGFWLGSVGKETRTGLPSSAGPGLVTAAVPTSPAQDLEAISTAMSTLVDHGGSFRGLARLGTLLDALDAVQIRELLKAVERLPPAEQEVWVPRLLAYWTKRDPEAATEWMQPRLEAYARDSRFASGFANFDTHLVRAWAENTPERAFDYARQHAGTGLARTVLHSAIFAWPDKNFARRFELLRGYPEGSDRQKVIVSLCFTWAQLDRTAALAGAASLPRGAERDSALAEVLARFAGSEPASAFKQAKILGLKDPALLTVMAKEAAKSDPVAAAEWIATHEPAQAADLAPVIAVFWAEKDPAAAFTWAREQGVSLTSTLSEHARRIPGKMFAGHAAEMTGDSPFSAALRLKPEETLAWVHSLPAGAERERYLELATRANAKVRNVR